MKGRLTIEVGCHANDTKILFDGEPLQGVTEITIDPIVAGQPVTARLRVYVDRLNLDMGERELIVAPASVEDSPPCWCCSNSQTPTWSNGAWRCPECFSAVDDAPKPYQVPARPSWTKPEPEEPQA